MEKQVMDQMVKARTRLLFDFPFFGSQAIKYPFKSTKNYNGIQVDTALTNGQIIAFNPEYVSDLSLGQKIFLCAHETGHNMLKHSSQLKGYNFDIANQAMDYVINDILISENIGEKIPGILIDEKYSKMPWQQVYSILYQEKQENEKQKQENSQDNNENDNDQSQSDNSDNSQSSQSDNSNENDNQENSQDTSQDNQDNGSNGSNGTDNSQENNESQSSDNGTENENDNQDDNSENGSGTEQQEKIANSPGGSVVESPNDIEHSEIDSQINQDIQSALNYAKKAGKMPGQKVKDLISEILAPKANWKDLLKQWIDSTDKTDMSYIRPIDRNNGYYSPGYFSEDINKIIIAIDVSGSVLSVPSAINAFQSEINELKIQFQFDCDVIYFHSNIEKIENYQKHENITIKIDETGGTRLMPVIDYIQDNGLQNQISGLIVFTDLEIFDFPKSDPEYKTLFVKYGNNRYCEKSPIGETINITENE